MSDAGLQTHGSVQTRPSAGRAKRKPEGNSANNVVLRTYQDTIEQGRDVGASPAPTIGKPVATVTEKYWFRRGAVFGGLLCGNAVDALRTLPSDLFNVAVTSPPYYWARDYGFKGQIGHEDDVEEFVASLADVFDEVRRVLHPEGVFFLNIGDTYYSGNGQPHGHDPRCSSRQFMRKKLRAVDRSGSYAGFWVTRRSGGVVCRHLDAVFKSDTCDDLRQLICAFQPPPGLRCGA